MTKSVARPMLLLMLPLILAACSNSNETTNFSSKTGIHQLTEEPKPETGLVKVKFDIDVNGQVQNARVVESEPKGVFDSEVLKAMSKWRYEKNSPMKDRVVSVRLNSNGQEVN
ncbi:TonB family protein [Serratia sp. 1D1416]|uniref:TonB family protein n=1 Tax=Serratia sp. 1D1416 TaxID=2447890 RepID=UPI0013E9F96B|nr:TonB family protein [Serratia sp. 1D1416]